MTDEGLPPLANAANISKKTLESAKLIALRAITQRVNPLLTIGADMMGAVTADEFAIRRAASFAFAQQAYEVATLRAQPAAPLEAAALFDDLYRSSVILDALSQLDFSGSLKALATAHSALAQGLERGRSKLRHVWLAIGGMVAETSKLADFASALRGESRPRPAGQAATPPG